MALKDWDTIAANNTGADGFPENMVASLVNDRCRELQASVREWYEDAEWVNLGETIARIDDTDFSIGTTDLTATYHVGRRVKLVGATTGYGVITATLWNAVNTVVTVSWDSGVTPTTLTAVNHAITSKVNPSISAKAVDLASATATSEGTVELTVSGEIDAGTDATRAITPSSLKASANAGWADESFTPVFFGFSADPSTPTVVAIRSGFAVHVILQFTVGTSDATTFTITNVPAAIQADTSQTIQLPSSVDNGSNDTDGCTIQIGTGATWFFGLGSTNHGGGGWTASGSKGLGDSTFAFSYLLDITP